MQPDQINNQSAENQNQLYSQPSSSPIQPANPGYQVTNNQPPLPIPPKKNNKKLFLILGLLLLIIGLVVAMYVFLGGTKKADTEKNSQSKAMTEESLEYEKPFEVADAQYGQDSIQEDSFAETGQYSPIPELYATFDDTTAYFITDAEEWRYYQLETASEAGVNRDLDDPCAELYAKYDQGINTVIKGFEDNGFSAERPKNWAGNEHFYSQYQDCSKGAMLQGADYTCSVVFELDSDALAKIGPENKEYVALKIACTKNKTLESKKADANVVQDIYRDTGGSESTSYTILPNYIKDSQTPGYKIALITSDASYQSFYYKKDGQKWVEVSGDDFSCSYVIAHPDVKSAFKGEKCTEPVDPSRGAYEEQTIQ